MTQDRPQLLHDLLRGPATAPGRLAVVAPDGGSVTFGELDQQTAALAGWLGDRGEHGDRIAVVADNGLAYLQLYYAVPRAGRMLALVNQRLSPAEQAAVIAASEPRILVGDARHLDELPAIRDEVPSLETVVRFGSPRWQEALRHHPLAETGTGTGSPARPVTKAPESPKAPDDPAWLVFTSGSTGTPKGVIHTHRSLLAAVRGSVEGRRVPEHGVYLFPFPMCHISGYNLLVQHATGSAVVLASRFRPDEFVATVNACEVTSCSLAPTMLHALLAHLEDNADLAHAGDREDREDSGVMPTLRAIAYGSAAISADLIDRATRRLKVDFHQGYGMTETGGNVTFLSPAGHRAGAAGDPEILRSAGRPHSQVELAVIDEHGDPVATGQGPAGEVVVRGEQVMPGYWRAAEATRDAIIEGGWFRTGDIGRLDEQGRLVIVDRAKDVIITGGENVSSREVEDALSTHPDVDVVAVVGVPDPYWGEAICAVVVPLPGRSIHADDVIAHARSRISAFKRPRHVVVTGALPLTPNGKIAKDRVRVFARAQVFKDHD